MIDVARMQQDLQTAQDMLNAVVEQRNGAQNQLVQVAAQYAAEKRASAEKDAKIVELEAKVKELTTPSDPAIEPQVVSKGNGKDHEAAVDASAI